MSSNEMKVLLGDDYQLVVNAVHDHELKILMNLPHRYHYQLTKVWAVRILNTVKLYSGDRYVTSATREEIVRSEADH